MKYFLYSLGYGLAAYYVLGFLKGGWYLGFFESYPKEGQLIAILAGGIFQTLVAIIVFGYPANWIAEYIRNNGFKMFCRTKVTIIFLAAIISALHSYSLLVDGNVYFEFLAMFVFLAPIPIILGQDEKHIKLNQKREGTAWY